MYYHTEWVLLILQLKTLNFYLITHPTLLVQNQLINHNSPIHDLLQQRDEDEHLVIAFIIISVDVIMLPHSVQTIAFANGTIFANDKDPTMGIIRTRSDINI